MSEKKILRVLVIDDSPDDTELTLSTLRKNGDFMLKSHRVQDLAAFQSALEKNEWDVILSEYTLPHFGAAVAHDVLRRAEIAVPFLVVTRAIRDADMIKIMRAGAQDVIVKGQLARLVPAIERELAVAAERREYRAATQTLKEVENKHRAIVEGSREAMCYSQDGMHVDANRAYLDIFEYQEFSELEGIPVMNLIDKSDQPRFKDFMRKQRAGGAAPQEFIALRKSGAKLHVEVTLSPITINGEECTQLLITDVSKRKAVETKLQYLNQHDPLTGLYNRAYITQELAKAIEQAKAGGKNSGAIYIDFHELKQVHNMLGHAAADRFLLKAVKVLREALGDRTTLARFGDHEFVALLVEIDERKLSERSAQVEKALKNTNFTDGGHTVHCACRIASAPINATAENSQKLLASMYRAAAPAEPPKPAAPAATAPPAVAPTPVPAASAPTPVAAAVTPAAVPATATRKVTGDWHDRIEHALQHDGFQLIYQPIISLHGDAAEYFEVLLRMTGRDDELIAAGEFMPPAEQSGQAIAIDRWVVKQSVQALADLVADGRQPIFFVNLCAAAIADEQLLITLESALKQYKANAQSLVFEIDEPAIVGKPKEAASFLRTLKRIGAKFCVDNFGKSMGALDYLRDLPIDYLKIDAALVRNVSRDPVNQASFKAILEVAKSLEKKTIAKGVESAEILSSLWTFGVDYAQGNYFQQADAATDYEFSGETTLSSDMSVPQWATAQTKSQGKTR